MLTKAQRNHLTWIEAREPVGAFTADGPSLSFVRRLEKLGLIERAGVESGRFGFSKFSLTDTGRRALQETSK